MTDTANQLPSCFVHIVAMYPEAVGAKISWENNQGDNGVLFVSEYKLARELC